MPTIAELNVEIGAELSKLDRGLQRATNSVKEFGNDVNKTNNSLSKGPDQAGKSYNTLGNIVKGVGVAMAAAFSIDAILNIGKQIIDVTANFQKMEAVLTNTLGSQSAAQNAMLMIQDLAAKTPFAVDQLTDSYVKLANRGIKPTSDEIIKLGDLAASTGKDFDQLTEGLLDAMTGQFERLKEFGITAAANGDKVKFTFKGVTTEVQKSDQAIKAYILSLGEVNGVTGSMAAISQTLGGRISNLGDSFTRLFNTIGTSSKGPLNFLIGKLTDLVEVSRRVMTSNEQLAKEGAAPNVSKFSEAISKELKTLAEESKAAGWDANAALALAFDTKKGPLQASMQNISKEIKRVREQLATPAVSNNPYLAGDLNKELVKLLTSYETAKGKLDALKSTFDAIGKSAAGANVPQEATVGIIAQLKKELEGLEADKLNAGSAGGIESINASIAAKEAQIKKYLELGEAQRKQQETLAELNKSLQLNGQYSTALGTSYDYVGQRIGILEGGIKNLVEVGFGPGSAAVQGFRKELDTLMAFEGRGGVMDTLPTAFERIIASIVAAREEMQQFAVSTVALQETAAPYIDSFTQASIDSFAAMTGALQTLAIDGFSLLGESIGQALAGNFEGVHGFFDGLMQIISQFLGALGKAVLATGVAGLALKKVFNNPIAAIAAGTALMVLSGVAGSIMRAGPGGSVSGGSATGGGSSYTPPTQQSTYRSTPTGPQTVTFEISGRSLIGIMKAENASNFRQG